MDEMKSKVLGAGLMAIGVAIPLYEKVRSTAEAAGDTLPGRLVGEAMKLIEPLARPVLGLIPGLGDRKDGGGSSLGEGRRDGHPPFGATAGPDRETSASSADTAAAPAPAKARGTSDTAAKKTAAKKTAAKKTSKKTSAKRSAGQSAAKGSTAKRAAGRGSRAKQGAKSPARRSTTASPLGGPASSGASHLVTLPLPTYTYLEMPAILDALNGLTKPQLQEIRDYEIANEGRAPIIDRIDKLLAVPLPGE